MLYDLPDNKGTIDPEAIDYISGLEYKACHPRDGSGLELSLSFRVVMANGYVIVFGRRVTKSLADDVHGYNHYFTNPGLQSESEDEMRDAYEEILGEFRNAIKSKWEVTHG
jgi:hypothetical protein